MRLRARTRRSWRPHGGTAGKMSRVRVDYIVVNRDLDPSVAAIKAIVTAERLRRTCRSFGYFVNCPRARPRRLA